MDKVRSAYGAKIIAKRLEQKSKTIQNSDIPKPVYEGKNVSAYIHFISTTTNTKTLHLEGTNYVFYFKVKNEDVAKGYWMGSSIGAKMLLNIVFKPYPVMKETVSNIDTKEFDKDPISLIRTFDNLLK